MEIPGEIVVDPNWTEGEITGWGKDGPSLLLKCVLDHVVCAEIKGDAIKITPRKNIPIERIQGTLRAMMAGNGSLRVIII